MDIEWLLPENVKKMDINKNAHIITNITIEIGRDILIFNSLITPLRKTESKNILLCVVSNIRA